MRFVKTFILLLLLVAMVLFFLQNSAELEKEFIFNFKLYVGDLAWTSGPIPFFFIVLVAFAFGCLVTLMLLGLDRFRLAAKIRQDGKKMKTMEKELQDLRQLPLNNDLSAPLELEQNNGQRPATPEV